MTLLLDLELHGVIAGQGSDAATSAKAENQESESLFSKELASC